MIIPTKIAIRAEDFDQAAEIAALKESRTDVGAIATFTGICRSENGALTALELEHYPGMAEAEIARMAEEATSRWPLLGLTVIHRHGKIEAGGNIVLVVTTSSHRAAAFAAAEFLMDYLKTRAPFWKKEHFADGRTGGWVEAKDIDDTAAERWTVKPAAE